MAPNNPLSSWGNDKTMNLNTLILTNIQSSPYFKVQLFELKTFHEVVDEIYYKVDHLEPWEKGSRKTAGQTGMCGGVRGVGAGGIVSSAYCLLFKLFTLKLTKKQVNNLITHSDSPYIRGLGFMYIRYSQPPHDLWDWYEPYLDDDELSVGNLLLTKINENTDNVYKVYPVTKTHPYTYCSLDGVTCGDIHLPLCIGSMTKAGQALLNTSFQANGTPRPEELDVKAGGGHIMTVGEMLRQWLVKLEWYSTLFPRIPVPIQKELDVKLRGRPVAYGYSGYGQEEPQQKEPQHIPDEEVSFGEAERSAQSQRGRGNGGNEPFSNGNFSRRSPPHGRSPPARRRTPPRRSPHSRDDFSRDLERERDRQRREKDRDRHKHKDEKKKSRSRSRERRKDDKDNHREKDQRKEREHKKEKKSHKHSKEKSRNKDRDRSKERDVSRERDRSRERKKESRNRSKERDVSRERDRSRDQERERKYS